MENETVFGGREVVVYENGEPLRDPAKYAYRVAVEFESEISWVDLFARFLASDGVERVEAFLVGAWGDVSTGDGPEHAVEALVGARNRLKALRALFVGDICLEESEISWIHQGDLSPILSAYPMLEEFRVRGGEGLSLGKISHGALKRLVIETGGMDRSIVQQVGAAELPSLEHLELWLGDDGYGANTSPEDLAPILDGTRFPRLSSLALRDCHYADDLAKAVARAPIMGKLRTLDLSLGTLGDEGAAVLLASPHIEKLSTLDLHHHYLSEGMMQRFGQLGAEVNLEERTDPDEWGGDAHRYVAVGE